MSWAGPTLSPPFRQLPHVSAANMGPAVCLSFLLFSRKRAPHLPQLSQILISTPSTFSQPTQLALAQIQLTSPSPTIHSHSTKFAAPPHLTDQMMDPKFGKPMYGPGRAELDQISDAPTRLSHHRRAQSETFFRFPDLDDILVDGVLADLNLEMPQQQQPKKSELAHLRSLSVDADFFEGLVLDGPPSAPRHRHSNSMDGYSSATSCEVDSNAKKAIAADRLAELALIDPKRAKRILANRQSAARSKERKTRYTGELERKVQTLQSEATTLSAQITLLQRDTNGLTAENKELKLKLQAMEQQAHLRDALNEALRNELQWLKVTASQMHGVNGSNRGSSSPFPPQPPMANYFGNQQSQQQLQQPQQNSSSNNVRRSP